MHIWNNTGSPNVEELGSRQRCIFVGVTIVSTVIDAYSAASSQLHQNYMFHMQLICISFQDYKTRIETMTMEYDRRISELLDKNIKLKAGLDNMKMQKEFLMGEMEYMNMKVREIVTSSEPIEGVKRTKPKRSHASVASQSSRLSRASNRAKFKQTK